MSVVNLPKKVVAFTPTCVNYKCFTELLYILLYSNGSRGKIQHWSCGAGR